MSILSDESLTAPVNCATFYTLRGHSPLLVTHLGEASQRSADDLRIRCRPHGGQGPHDETAVALGHHARIEDCNDASVIGGTQEAPHALGHHERRMRERDGDEAVASPAFDVHGSGARHRIVRARERNLVDDDEAAGFPCDVDPLP